MARARDEIREQRIAMEAVVDTYDSSERAMGWYYYLDGKMKVPFKARCRFVRPISVLKLYLVQLITRNSFGLMTRKLSVTKSQRPAQFRGTFSRRKLSVASANWAHVA